MSYHRRCSRRQRAAAPFLIQPLESRVLLAADVALIALDMSPTNMAPGAHPTSLTETIWNNGPASVSAGDYDIDFYLSTDNFISPLDTFIGTNTITTSLGVGQSTGFVGTPASLAFITIPANTPPGDYRVGAHLRATGVVTDPIDANNWIGGNVINVDMAGNTVASAVNVGAVSATPLFLDEYVGVLDTDDFYRISITGPSLLTVLLANLGADADLELRDSAGQIITSSSHAGTENESISYLLIAGTYYVGVYRVTGTTAYSLGMTAASLSADVALTALDMGPTSIAPGSNPANFTATVWNNGPGNLSDGEYALDFYLSTDNFISDSDTYIGTNTITASIDANQSGGFYGTPASLASITIPPAQSPNALAAGPYRLGAHLRPTGIYLDPNDANNWLIGSIINVDYAANDLAHALSLGLFPATLVFNEYVGTMDTDDFYSFTVTVPMTLRRWSKITFTLGLRSPYCHYDGI